MSYAHAGKVDVTHTFATKDEEIVWVMGGVTPNTSGESRIINPGEIAVICLIERDSNPAFQSYLFDPLTGGRPGACLGAEHVAD